VGYCGLSVSEDLEGVLQKRAESEGAFVIDECVRGILVGREEFSSLGRFSGREASESEAVDWQCREDGGHDESAWAGDHCNIEPGLYGASDEGEAGVGDCGSAGVCDECDGVSGFQQ